MRNDGGPAFPQTQTLDPEPGRGFVSGLDVADGGMTMRDYFAAKAMQALIQCVWERNGDSNYIIDNDGRVSLHLRSYEHADSMLAEREKGRS